MISFHMITIVCILFSLQLNKNRDEIYLFPYLTIIKAYTVESSNPPPQGTMRGGRLHKLGKPMLLYLDRKKVEDYTNWRIRRILLYIPRMQGMFVADHFEIFVKKLSSYSAKKFQLYRKLIFFGSSLVFTSDNS